MVIHLSNIKYYSYMQKFIIIISHSLIYLFVLEVSDILCVNFFNNCHCLCPNAQVSLPLVLKYFLSLSVQEFFL